MCALPTSLQLIKEVLNRLASGQTMTEDQAEEVFEIIMSGDATPAQIGGLLLALRMRGETVDEITGAARVMQAKALPMDAPPGAIDTCGTGGDSAGTYNISTAVAFVVAACGIPVAKHGNRALSSRSGSSDVLAALGVKVDCDMALVRESLWTANFGFLMAPRHHNATRHVSGPRVELGMRTIFNLLGPLANPARTKRQIVGVFAPQWVEPMATVLGRLGLERAWVVHGTDGLDEITTTGPTMVAELNRGEVRKFSVTPEEAGLPRGTAAALRGGDAETNAAALRAVLNGDSGPYRDIVILNTAAALIVCDRAQTLREGAEKAAQALDSGKALDVLEQVIAITNRPPPPVVEDESET